MQNPDEIKKLLFSIKNKIFTDETLKYYEKYYNNIHVFEEKVCLYKRLDKTDFEIFKEKISKDGYFSMEILNEFSKKTRKTYYKMNPVYNCAKIAEIGEKSFKFENKYYFFDELIIKDFYKTGNQHFSNITFSKRVTPLQIKKVESLINEDFKKNINFRKCIIFNSKIF